MAEWFRHGDSWWAWTCLNYPTSVSKFRGMHFCIKFCKICIAALSDDDRRPVPRVCGARSRSSVDYLLALVLGLKHFAPLMLESRVLRGRWLWAGAVNAAGDTVVCTSPGVVSSSVTVEYGCFPRFQLDAGCLASAWDQLYSAGETKGQLSEDQYSLINSLIDRNKTWLKCRTMSNIS